MSFQIKLFEAEHMMGTANDEGEEPSNINNKTEMSSQMKLFEAEHMMGTANDQSVARTERQKNGCNKWPFWASPETSKNGHFACEDKVLFSRNFVLFELSVYARVAIEI